MTVPNRNYQSPEYRYGFQGQEKDDEIKGSGNSINYKFRMHDPRVGRFFAVDPLKRKFAFNSPYVFSLNMVINSIELEGLENFFTYYSGRKHEDSDTKLQTAGKITGNVVVGVVNIIPYVFNVANSVVNEGPMGPIEMINNDLNDISLIIAGDMIKSKQSGEFSNGADYLIDRAQKKEVIEAFIQAVVTKKVFKPVRVQLNALVSRRLSLAKSFFKKSGVSDVDGHLNAMKLDNPVSTKTLPVGTELYRFSVKGTKSPKHYFTLDEKAIPSDLGKGSFSNKPSQIIKEKFTLTKPTKVLKSTVNLDGKSGAQQVFSVDIQGSSTSKVIPLFK